MAAAGLTDSPETADNNGERNAVTMVSEKIVTYTHELRVIIIKIGGVRPSYGCGT
jgi:hypothetical protein